MVRRDKRSEARACRAKKPTSANSEDKGVVRNQRGRVCRSNGGDLAAQPSNHDRFQRFFRLLHLLDRRTSEFKVCGRVCVILAIINEFYTFDLMKIRVKKNCTAKLTLTLNFKMKIFTCVYRVERKVCPILAIINEFYTFDLMEIRVKKNCTAKLTLTLNFKIKIFFSALYFHHDHGS